MSRFYSENCEVLSVTIDQSSPPLKVLQLIMDTDKITNFIAIGLVLFACVNILMKFMPDIATQLPLPVYDFFYSITVNTEPNPPTENFSQKIEPDSL